MITLTEAQLVISKNIYNFTFRLYAFAFVKFYHVRFFPFSLRTETFQGPWLEHKNILFYSILISITNHLQKQHNYEFDIFRKITVYNLILLNKYMYFTMSSFGPKVHKGVSHCYRAVPTFIFLKRIFRSGCKQSKYT